VLFSPRIGAVVRGVVRLFERRSRWRFRFKVDIDEALGVREEQAAEEHRSREKSC
jgi:hypothetical protein